MVKHSFCFCYHANRFFFHSCITLFRITCRRSRLYCIELFHCLCASHWIHLLLQHLIGFLRWYFYIYDLVSAKYSYVILNWLLCELSHLKYISLDACFVLAGKRCRWITFQWLMSNSNAIQCMAIRLQSLQTHKRVFIPEIPFQNDLCRWMRNT